MELFHRGDGAPSLGRYHTGLADISHQSRSTTQAHEALAPGVQEGGNV